MGFRASWLPHMQQVVQRSASRGTSVVEVTGAIERARGSEGVVVGVLHNLRIKLTACGTRSHGKGRRLTHAAAYPHRYAGNKRMLALL